jgi:hypothetical protein
LLVEIKRERATIALSFVLPLTANGKLMIVISTSDFREEKSRAWQKKGISRGVYPELAEGLEMTLEGTHLPQLTIVV